jgi:alpha/beta superfamily hydrolase
MQEPFYFGPEGREIFGMYHPALATRGGILTVICPPLYSEYGRSHSALRNLALALAQSGHDVLRMEYSGTGDSYGELGDASLRGWVDEISMAIDEGRALSGCRQARVLGVRGSALLACQAVRARNDVGRLALWDPVPNGREYCMSLQREQDYMLKEHLHLAGADCRKIRAQFDLYRMPIEMWEEWSTLDASVYSDVGGAELRVVRTENGDPFEFDNVEQTLVDVTVDWEVTNSGVFLCQPVLESLHGYLTAP